MTRSTHFLSMAACMLSTIGCSSDYGLQHFPENPKPGVVDNNSFTEPDPIASDRPVAICDVLPSVIRPFHDTATWLGNGYDPNGYEIISHEWTLVGVPVGSSAPLPESADKQIVFQADLAGTYVAELVVTNENGVESEPCQVELQAIPGQALWVEMFWTESGDDMDLHLIAPGGRYGGRLDCHYENCTQEDGGLDWGIVGEIRDDAFLDFDDIDGVGPENINIQTPIDGLYRVAVHDYPDSVVRRANDVTVKVYIEGESVWEDTRSISGEDSVTDFAAIDVNAGVVNSL